MDKLSLSKCFESLSTEARELYLSSYVPNLPRPPTSLEFYRNYVTPNKPVVIEGVCDGWPALTKWSNQYLRDKIGDQEVTVAVTPNGYADAVTDNKFVMPEERPLKFSVFLDILYKERLQNGIFYVQKQNSNFTDEFRSLMQDAPSHIDWANQAFGTEPDAVNFWMGDERAISSMHKDPYENLYCVVRGQKTFTLIPPTDQAFIPYGVYEAATYNENSEGTFDVVPSESVEKVPWIAIDPLAPDLDRFPDYAKAKPLTVTVNAGQTLYLPSLWFHHVQQSHGCIAVNYWYDMEYDIKYNYFNFIENLLKSMDKT